MFFIFYLFFFILFLSYISFLTNFIFFFCFPSSYYDHFFIFCLSSFSPPITSHYSILFVSHHFLSLFFSYLLPIIAFCLSSLLFVSHHSFLSPITLFRLPSLLFASYLSFSSPTILISPFYFLSLPITLFYSIVISFFISIFLLDHCNLLIFFIYCYCFFY